MGRRIPLLAVGLLLVGFSPVAASDVKAVHPQDVFNLDGGPFHLKAIETASASSAAKRTSLAFEVENTSSSLLRRIGVEAAVFSASGQIKGYFIFEMPTQIEPGASVVAYYTTADYRVAPTAHVVLLPYSAAGQGLRWRVSEDELIAATRSLVTARGDASLAPLIAVHAAVRGRITPQNPYSPGDPGNSGCNLTACQSAQSSCKETCSPCGMQNSTCNCNPDGTVASVSCSCYQCTPPK